MGYPIPRKRHELINETHYEPQIIRANTTVDIKRSASLLILLHLFITLAYSQSSPVEQKCQPTNSFFCNIDNYNTVQPFNNTLGHISLESARSDLHKYAFFLTSECKNKVQLFLCSLYFPVCVSPSDVTSRFLLPCRDICEEARTCEPDLVRALNTTWPAEWNCNSFEYYTNDHKLCVINNQKEAQPNSESDLSRTYESSHHTARYIESKQPHDPLTKLLINSSPGNGRGRLVNQQVFPPAVPSLEQVENPSVCDNGLFDCQLSDPKRPLCIEMKYVCDGKKDCIRNDSIYELNMGFDELNCPQRLCAEGQLYCDDKCIPLNELCDGKSDCSSGFDEQNCYDSFTGPSIIGIVGVFLVALFIFVKFFRDEAAKLEDHHVQDGTPREEIDSEIRIAKNHSPVLTSQEQYKQPQPRDKMTSPLEQNIGMPTPRSPLLHIPFSPTLLQEPMYQEVSTRGDSIYNYERVLPGGDSGASSIYASGSYFGDEPLAPPPTRSATPIY